MNPIRAGIPDSFVLRRSAERNIMSYDGGVEVYDGPIQPGFFGEPSQKVLVCLVVLCGLKQHGTIPEGRLQSSFS